MNIADTGASLEGIPLLFEVVQGGGIFLDDKTIYSTLTNQDGKGAIHYHFGMATPDGTNKVRVSVHGDDSVAPVNFTLTGYLPMITVAEPELKIRCLYDSLNDVFNVTVKDPRKNISLKNVKVKTRTVSVYDGRQDNYAVMLPKSRLTDTDGQVKFGFSMLDLGGYFDPATSQPLKKNSSHIGLPPMLNQYLWIPIVDNGQAQIGVANQKLNKPLKVYVNKRDANGNLIPAQVTFTVKVGGGTIVGTNPQMTVDGYAQIEYIFGPTATPQIIEAASEGETIYFVAGPPEIRYVKLLSGVFSEITQLPTYGIFTKDWQYQAIQPESLYYIEYLLPLGYSGTPSLEVAAYDECGNKLSQLNRAIAPLLTNVTLTKVEETERFSRYRTPYPIQNTQELYQPNMAVFSGLPSDRTILEAIPGGHTYTEDISLGIKDSIPNESVFVVDSNGLRRIIISEINYHPSISLPTRPTVGVSYLMKYDNETTSPAVFVNVQGHTETIVVKLNKYQPGLYRSEKPIVVADADLDLSAWPYLNEYTVIRTRSDNSNDLELESIGSGSEKTDTTKSALMFMCIDKDENYGRNYRDAKYGLESAIDCLNKKLGYEMPPNKNPIDKITRYELIYTNPDEKNSVPYVLDDYSVLHIEAHAAEYQDVEKYNRFAGLCLGKIVNGKFVYDTSRGIVRGDEDKEDWYAGVLFAKQLYEMTINPSMDFHPKYKFAFLNVCRSAEDRNRGTGNPYLMSDGVDKMAYGLKTIAYMGWVDDTRFPGASAFAQEFYKGLWYDRVSKKPTAKNVPLKQAGTDALNTDKVKEYPYVKDLITLLFLDSQRIGNPKPIDIDTYHIDIRK